MINGSWFVYSLPPILRLGVVFLIVWVFHNVTDGWLSGGTRLGAVIALSFVTWIVVAKFVFEPLMTQLRH